LRTLCNYRRVIEPPKASMKRPGRSSGFRPNLLEDEAGQILVLQDRVQIPVDIRGVDGDLAMVQLRSVEREFLGQAFDYRMQAARTYVLGPRAYPGCDFGQCRNCFGFELKPHTLRRHQGHVLLRERVFGFGENPQKVLTSERRQFNPDRKAALEFRNQ